MSWLVVVYSQVVILESFVGEQLWEIFEVGQMVNLDLVDLSEMLDGVYVFEVRVVFSWEDVVEFLLSCFMKFGGVFYVYNGLF